MTLPNRTPLRFIHWDPVEQQNSAHFPYVKITLGTLMPTI